MTAVAGYVTAMADLRAKTRLRTSVSPHGARAQDGAEEDDAGGAPQPKAKGKSRGRGGRGGAAANAAVAE